jgi:hypothetical protein
MPDLAEPGPNVREPETSFADRTGIPAASSHTCSVRIRGRSRHAAGRAPAANVSLARSRPVDVKPERSRFRLGTACSGATRGGYWTDDP